MRCTFIPPYLLDKVAASADEHVARCGHRTREIDAGLRAARETAAAQAVTRAGAAWEVYSAGNGSTLPGTPVRSAGEPEAGDPAVDEAAVGLTESLAFLADLGRASYDGKGAGVVATVHYEQDYDNAFWDGTQLVFGDGDGKVFGRFTRPIDVLGHELSHAVTQYTADLTYSGQSGALNESVSDCFGSCVKQRHLGQDTAAADWLIGEGIFLPGVHGRALRSMKAPGTAYDDPTLGKDPQVASMADYVDTSDDNGGVHINSGIPNKAFYLAATAIGGTSWAGAGRIWYAALTSGVAAGATFADFAQATVDAAGPHAAAVADAWAQVGVTPGLAAPAPRGPAHLGSTLEVTRSGGFGGMVRRGALDLDSDDPRAPEARQLLDRIDLAGVGTGLPQPDRFVYDFRVGEQHARVHEADLTDSLQRLAALLLD